jgi:antitoxin component YwqK of YwqJK toxin-antitoxin module
MPDKDFKIIGYYNMDEKDSIWSVYKNNALISKINYTTHQRIAYYDNNNVMFMRDSIKGKKVEKIYFKSGKLKSELIYEKSDEDWEYKEYNEDGELSSNIVTKNDVPYSIYNANSGLNKYEGNIINGTGQFNTIEYDPMDRKSYISQKVNILNGRLHGEYISFSKNGEIRNQGKFENGYLIGTWKIKDGDGFKKITYNIKDSINKDTINHIYY